MGFDQARRRTFPQRRRRLRLEPLESRSLLATISVTSFDDIVDGSDGQTSLREAISLANTNGEDDVITLAAGTYAIALTGTGEDDNALGDFNLTERNRSVTLQGLGADQTIIDGAALDSVLQTEIDVTLVVRDLTIQNGNSLFVGGGIHAFGPLQLERVSLRNNTARSSGGGILAASTLVVADSLFDGNQGKQGGAIWSDGPTLSIHRSRFLSNQAVDPDGAAAGSEHGGGVGTGQADTIIVDTTFRNNRATGFGGGIYFADELSEGTMLDIRGTTFDRNEAASGGGLKVASGFFGDVSAAVENSTFYNNDAIGDFFNSIDGNGAGIANDGTLTLTNVTIARNFALDNGGGLANGLAGNVMMLNTLIANNYAPNGSEGVNDGTITSAGGNLIADDTGFLFTAEPSDQVGPSGARTHPQLGPLADNGGPTETLALLAGSPAMERGVAAGAPATDQRGMTRPQDGDTDGDAGVDIGAFEFTVNIVELTIPASKDNTIFSHGAGDTSNGAGQYLFAGSTLVGHLERGLLAFDIAAQLNPGDTIVGVDLTLNLNATQDTAARPFTLHRVTSNWGESTTDAPGDEYGGSTANAGDATWLESFYPNQRWNRLGGGGDFVTSASGSALVGTDAGDSMTGTPQQWSSTEMMVADVQQWLDDPATNFGWALLGDESTQDTERRFNTRETPFAGSEPRLTIRYIPAPEMPEVVNRQVFYNNSSFDGQSGANPNDDLAIDHDKRPLVSGQAQFQNYTSYTRGINGLIIDFKDIGDLAGLSLNDFDFRVGNDSDLTGWNPAPSPVILDKRPGAGLGGADRVTLIWNDHAIQNTWLQVTVKAGVHTGLAASDVFFWGNAVGEAGDTSLHARVDAFDRAAVRDNAHGAVNVIDDRDFNRDQAVDGADLAIARDFTTNFTNDLELITIPSTPPDAGSTTEVPVVVDLLLETSSEPVPAASDVPAAAESLQPVVSSRLIKLPMPAVPRPTARSSHDKAGLHSRDELVEFEAMIALLAAARP